MRTSRGSQHTYSKLHSSRLSNARGTTTQHKHSTELALCPRCPPAWASGGHIGGSAWTPTAHQCSTQWEGRGWLDRTHDHMAPEHATDTNEPRRDARSYKLGFGDPCALLTERAMVTQLMTRLLTGDSMSDLQLWSQLVTKCQNTDLTIMVLPTFPRNRDTANEDLSTVTEYFTKLNDMCAVETELDHTRHPEH